jgi:hypothetical protein
MSKWQHGIIEKKVINLDHGGSRHVACAWDTCESDGVDLHQVRVNYGKNGMDHIVKHVFCSDRHKQYWINSTRGYGRLPPGYRRSVI